MSARVPPVLSAIVFAAACGGDAPPTDDDSATADDDTALDDDTTPADDDTSPARKRPRVLGHRGMGSNDGGNPHAENSLGSFLAALQAGADGVELDVQLTSDAVMVVAHDEELDRTTTCTGCFIDRTLAELDACEAHAEDPTQDLQPIPTLEEVVDALPVDAFLEIEAKGFDVPGSSCRGPYADEAAVAAAKAEALVAFVDERGLLDRVHLTSFVPEAVARVEDLAPEIDTGLLWYTGVVDDMVTLALDAGVDAMDVHQAVLYADTTAEAFALAGLRLWTWGVVTEADVDRVLAHQPEEIITDHPDTVIPWVDAWVQGG